MNFLHREVQTSPQSVIIVTLDRQANVRLLDDHNFRNYRSGLRHSYHGGLAKVSPMRLSAPYAGRWHVVIDLGGYGGTVCADVQVVG